MKTLRLDYTSGWFTVIFPTLIFFLGWFGFFLIFLAILDWKAPDWLGMLLFFGGIPVGLVLAVFTYPFLLKLAQGKKGEIFFEKTTFQWRIGRQPQQIDLSKDYYGEINADENAVSIDLFNNKEKVILYFYGLGRDKVLEIFPEEFFIDQLVITPKMGSWGFEINVDNPTVEDFVISLLKTLWKTRQNNRFFLIYKKFPWQQSPKPKFSYIRLLNWEKRTLEEERLIAGLKKQIIDGLTDSYVRLTPDYLLGWVYKSFKSHLTGEPDYYCLMPIGEVEVEVSFPRPDWQPFIIGHFLVEAAKQLAKSFGGKGGGYGPFLQHRRYLYIRGQGVDGKKLTLAFDWYTTADAIYIEKYYEAECLVKFVQVMTNKNS